MKSALPPADDSAVETWLREHAPQPSLPDAGFTLRVLAALPAPRRRHRATLRTFFILAGAIAGCAIAGWQLAAGPALVRPVDGLSAAITAALAALLAPPVLLALGLAALSVLYANWTALRQNLAL